MRSIPHSSRSHQKKQPQLFHGDATEGGRWGRSHGWVANVAGCVCVFVCVRAEREANMIDCASVTACVQCHPLLFWSAESWMWIPRASCSLQACLPFVAPMRQWRADESDRQRNREPPRTTQTKASRASGFQNGCAKRRCHRVSPLLRVGATRAIRVICESVCKKRLSR